MDTKGSSSRSVYTNNMKNRKGGASKFHRTVNPQKLSKKTKLLNNFKVIQTKLEHQVGDFIVRAGPPKIVLTKMEMEHRYSIPNVFNNLNIIHQAYYRTHAALSQVLLEMKKMNQFDVTADTTTQDRVIEVV
jgi:hypothetical protein